MTKPTEKQYRQLRSLGSNHIVIVPGKRDWTPLLRRGWVENAWPDREHDNTRYLPPLRITPDGLRAVAVGIETYGNPAPTPDERLLANRRCSCKLGQRPSCYCSVHGEEEREREDAERTERRVRERFERLLDRIGNLAVGDQGEQA